MYTISDVEEMGNAQELILVLAKPEIEQADDQDLFTSYPEEIFDR